MNDGAQKDAAQVVREDLIYICSNLQAERSCIAGKRLLITGGAGFLGHYLVQALLEHNRTAVAGGEIEVTVYDNFMRGVPNWLRELDGNPTLRIVQRDITDPLPTTCRTSTTSSMPLPG